MLRPLARAAFVLFVGVGCHGGGDAPATSCGPQGCAPKVDECAVDERPIAGGGCSKAGVTACGAGFVADGAGGCAPVLPKDACPKGQLALPGEASCHPVAPCTGGPWGELPGGTVVRVDASAPAAGADGTEAHPFPTIQAAIDLATEGSTVAIAKGHYVENLVVRKRITLAGRCPEEVFVEGASDSTFTFDVTAPVTIENLSATGKNMVIGIADTKGVVVDHVWIHDAKERAIDVEDPNAETEATVRDSLFEGDTVVGVYAHGSTLTVERSVVRGIAADASSKYGFGIYARRSPDTKRPSTLTVRGSLIEDVQRWGVSIEGSSGVVDSTLVRSVHANGKDPGVGVETLGDAGGGGTLAISSSVISAIEGLGLDSQAASITFDQTTVSDVVSARGGNAGLVVDTGALVLHHGAFLRVSGAALHLDKSGGSVDGFLAADAQADPLDGAGMGIYAVGDPDAMNLLTVHDAVVRKPHLAGLLAAAMKMDVTDFAVLDAVASDAGEFGDGVVVTAGRTTADGRIIGATATLTRGVLRRNARAGVVVFGGTATLTSSLLGCNALDMVAATEIAPGVTTDAPHIIDGGDNVCGCDAVTTCRAQTADLTPISVK